MAGAESYFCCIYIIDRSPATSSVRRYGSYVLCFVRGRQVGAQQDSSNTPIGHGSSRSWSVRSIVTLIFVIFVLLSSTLESTLAWMRGKFKVCTFSGA